MKYTVILTNGSKCVIEELDDSIEFTLVNNDRKASSILSHQPTCQGLKKGSVVEGLTTQELVYSPELILAAQEVLSNAVDVEAVIVEADIDPEIDDYPCDADGDAWYHDWYALDLAIAAATGEPAWSSEAVKLPASNSQTPWGGTTPEPTRWFNNHYVCSECGYPWCETSPGVMDDKCPKCNTACSPTSSEDADQSGRPLRVSTEQLYTCDECGEPFVIDEHGVSIHCEPDGEIDYAANEDHTPYGEEKYVPTPDWYVKDDDGTMYGPYSYENASGVADRIHGIVIQIKEESQHD